MEFTWDDVKAELNLLKHGISFAEAQTVFGDENATLIADPDNSGEDEDRFVLLGLSLNLRLLVVVHVYREEDEVIRIISARRATKSEAKQYVR